MTVVVSHPEFISGSLSQIQSRFRVGARNDVSGESQAHNDGSGESQAHNDDSGKSKNKKTYSFLKKFLIIYCNNKFSFLLKCYSNTFNFFCFAVYQFLKMLGHFPANDNMCMWHDLGNTL